MMNITYNDVCCQKYDSKLSPKQQRQEEVAENVSKVLILSSSFDVEDKVQEKPLRRKRQMHGHLEMI
jgi:hypothetical protein